MTRAISACLPIVMALFAACSGTDDITVAGTNAIPEPNCLDRPDELPRPPDGRLPCELMPPGWAP